MSPATQCNPSLDIRSILELTPGSASNKLQAALRPLGCTLADLARQLGVSRGHLSVVINDKRESARLKRRIADRLGVAVTDIWPSEQAA